MTHRYMKYKEEFPLDSLSVEIDGMKYYYDLEGSKSQSLGVINGLVLINYTKLVMIYII